MAKRHKVNFSESISVIGRAEELILANSHADPFYEIFLVLIALNEIENGQTHLDIEALRAEDMREAIVRGFMKSVSKIAPNLRELRPISELGDELLLHIASILETALSQVQFGSLLDALFEQTTSASSKGSKGQFFTPRFVIEACVKAVGPIVGDRIIDPACGSAGFLTVASSVMNSEFQNHTSSLVGIDIDQSALEVGALAGYLLGVPNLELSRMNSLEVFANGGDESELLRPGTYDIVFSNPPFAGDVVDSKVLSAFDLALSGRKVERDVLFLELAAKLLRPGGRLCIVLPQGKLVSSKFRYVREWLLAEFDLITVVSLGRNTFTPHTSQKTEILFGVKKKEDAARALDGDILLLKSENPGKDSKGTIILRKSSDGDSSLDSTDTDLGQIARIVRERFQQGGH